MNQHIRPAETGDLDEVMALWLAGNLASHDYVDPEYWRAQAGGVRSAIATSQLFVYEDMGEILGFIGLLAEHLAGLFVSEQAQNRGIGGDLLKEVQKQHPYLTLAVYEKNPRALAFYQKHGFKVQHYQVDEATGEREYVMVWQKKTAPSDFQ